VLSPYTKILTSFINSTALIPRLNLEQASINPALKNKNKISEIGDPCSIPVNIVNFFDSNFGI